MASNSFDKLIEEIGKMSVLELADLVKALEDKFGVSTAAMSMSQGLAGAPAAVPAAGEEKKSAYKVTLKDAGTDKIKSIKALKKVTSLGLSEAKKAVEEAPTVIGDSIPEEDAMKIKKELEAAGAKVDLS